MKATERFERLRRESAGNYRTDDGWFRIHREAGLLNAGGEWSVMRTPLHLLSDDPRCHDRNFRTLAGAREELAEWREAEKDDRDRYFAAKEKRAAELDAIVRNLTIEETESGGN